MCERLGAGRGGTVVCHVPLLRSEASYMKEASKTAGVTLKTAVLYPCIDSQSVSGKIGPGGLRVLSNFHVNNVFLTLKLRDLHYL